MPSPAPGRRPSLPSPTRSAIGLAAGLLLVACAAAPRPSPVARTAPPPAAPAATAPAAPITPSELRAAWRAGSPDARAHLETLVIARLFAEAGARRDPSQGLVSEQAVALADAILDEVSGATRDRLAHAMIAWLLERAWSAHDGRVYIQRAMAALGDDRYDAIVSACEGDARADGLPSFMLYSDEPGRDALFARLLPRLQALFRAFVTPHDAPRLAQLRRLAQLTEALDRPAPLHEMLLAVISDPSLPATARLEALSWLHRSNLPFVAPALLRVASSPGDVVVRGAVIALLGRMHDGVTSATLASLYDRTPPGSDGVPLRIHLGVALLLREGGGARRWLAPWVGRADARRADRPVIEGWAAVVRLREALVDTLWRDPSPDLRALAIVTWAQCAHTSLRARVEALALDRGRLLDPSWGDAYTVGALARQALREGARQTCIEEPPPPSE